MSRWRRFRALFRKKKKGEALPVEVLREFIYLDDVSVDSLVASIRGSILDQITQTTGSEVLSELGSTLGASSPAISAEVRSRLQTTTSEGLQTLRRAGIQARFRELHQIVEHRRVIRPTGSGVPPVVSSVEEIKALDADATGSRWALPVSDLQRGDVVEVDVELATEPLFHMVSAMTQILDLWPENPDLVGLEPIPAMGQIQAISKMLSVMLGGLVPIRSRSIDFDAVRLDGEPWLVHHRILDQLPSEGVEDRRPLEIVGVAAEDRFWKDQRRVVFAGARYRILARLVGDGTSATWTPVKMVDAFKDFVPGFAEAIDDATRQGQQLLSGSSSPVELSVATYSDLPPGETSPSRRLVDAYARLLGNRVGLSVAPSDLDSAGLTVVDTDLPSVEETREFLAPVTDYVQARSGNSIDPVIISDTRLAARREVQQDRHAPGPGESAHSDRATVPSLLEVEFVAVYW